MANELLTRDDIIRGKQNFDAQNQYMTGTADEQVTLPDGQKIKTRAGHEKELKDKFPDTKAGLRDVGDDPGEVPVMTANGLGLTGFGAFRPLYFNSTDSSGIYSLNRLGLYYVSKANVESEVGNEVSLTGGSVLNIGHANSHLAQIFIGPKDGKKPFDFKARSSSFSLETESGFRDVEWASIYHSLNTDPYITTTANAANMVITSTGEQMRSTSSRVFKTDIKDIELPDYRAALKAVRPVSYRSIAATADNTDWSWYSFIAEEVAAIDPRLVQMSSTEFFEDTDEDGNTFVNNRELPEGEYAPSGLNTNGIVTLMARINQYMLADIEKLEDEKTQLKRRMTNLEKRMDAFDGSTPAE